MQPRIIVTTGDAIEGRAVVEYLDIVHGLVVRLPKTADAFQALGSMLSGNVQSTTRSYYEESGQTALEQAFERMVERAQQLGADAIIAMRYSSTEIGGPAAEVLAYGTAVKLQPLTPA